MKTTQKLGILMMFAILLIGAASATVTFITPGSAATITGATYKVNLTTTVGAVNGRNCSVAISSALTGDSTTGTAYNFTASGSAYNFTLDTTTLEDGTDYVFSAICFNSTANESGSRTGITVDNTVPTAPTGYITTSSDKENVPFTSAVTGARTTACTLTISGSTLGSTTYTMTHAGDTCTKTMNLPGSGNFIYYITASDGTNTTKTANVNLKVEESGGRVVTGTTTTSTTTDNSTGMKTFFVVVIGVAAFLYFTKDGGERKRKKSRR